jgi:hypothetical protein
VHEGLHPAQLGRGKLLNEAREFHQNLRIKLTGVNAKWIWKSHARFGSKPDIFVKRDGADLGLLFGV